MIQSDKYTFLNIMDFKKLLLNTTNIVLDKIIQLFGIIIIFWYLIFFIFNFLFSR